MLLLLILSDRASSQTKGEVIYERTFATEHFSQVSVQAINTKGFLDGFDRIYIRIKNEFFNEYFEVKRVDNIEAYLLSSNGVKEGPLRIKMALTRRDDAADKYLLPFVQPDITDYIVSLLSRSTNKSNVRDEGLKQYYMIPLWLEECSIHCVDPNDSLIHDFLDGYEPTSSNYGSLIPSLTRNVKGTCGNYTIRFYDLDNNINNYEHITIQKEGELEFILDAMLTIKTDIKGMDTNIDIGFAEYLYFKGEGECAISDDDLCDYLLHLLYKEKGTRNNTDVYVKHFAIPLRVPQ